MGDNATINEPASSQLAELNALSAHQFTARLADVFEHSPWVAQRAAPSRPFKSVAHLHQVMVAAMHQASEAEKIALLRAHPELAGQEAQRGTLTAASDQEQARAGLKALSPDEMARISGLNSAYRARHGFPFIVCVGQHTKQSLFAAFERRTGNNRETELPEALSQVEAITRLRLDAMFAP